MKAQIILCMLGFSAIAYSQQGIYSRHNQQLPANAVIQENTLQRTFEHLDKSKLILKLLPIKEKLSLIPSLMRMI